MEDADFINELEIQIFKFLQVLKFKTVMITDVKIAQENKFVNIF